MPVVFLLLTATALVWWVAFADRGSLLIGCALFVAAGYVLGPDLMSVDVGPVTLTADRLLLAALAAAFVWQWRTGRVEPRRLAGTDLLLIALVAYLSLRCALTSPPEVARPGAGPWWRIISAFWAPAALYFIAKNSDLSERSWRRMLVVLAALGAYLALTAVAEVSQQWWAVFPRYIADPTLGTHFGRARGPALMSASLGVFLTVCGWAAWMLVSRVGRVQQLLLAGMLPLMAAGVYLTYTRSTWIGLAAGAMIVPLLQWRREWRPILTAGILLAAVVGAATLGGKLTNLGRQDTDGSAEHSVYQRASFLYVSWQMFRDAPLVGCGVARFYDCKMPYLSDRSQALELESLRDLDHHNTLLSLLVETGLIGFALFLAVLAALSRSAWSLYRDESNESWIRAHGVFSLATLVAYMATALFHDLTLSPTEHWLLFLTAGVTSGLTVRHGVAPRPATAPNRLIATAPTPTALPI